MPVSASNLIKLICLYCHTEHYSYSCLCKSAITLLNVLYKLLETIKSVSH